MKRGTVFTLLAMGVIAVSMAFRVFADEPVQPANLNVYSGIVRAIDLNARTITVDGSAVPQTFIVPAEAEIIVKDKPKGDLSDLVTSDGVQIKYSDDNGVHVAHQISLLSLKAP